jgi:hypothetical protein
MLTGISGRLDDGGLKNTPDGRAQAAAIAGTPSGSGAGAREREGQAIPELEVDGHESTVALQGICRLKD